MPKLIAFAFALLIAAMLAIMLLPLQPATWVSWSLIVGAGVCVLVAWLVMRRRIRRLR